MAFSKGFKDDPFTMRERISIRPHLGPIRYRCMNGFSNKATGPNRSHFGNGFQSAFFSPGLQVEPDTLRGRVSIRPPIRATPYKPKVNPFTIRERIFHQGPQDRTVHLG